MLSRDVQMSSGRAMSALGPILHVIFAPDPDADAEPRQRTAERVAMLVDTDADCTMVDDRTPRALGHRPAHFTWIGGATGAPQSLPVYRMEMIVRMVDGTGMSRDVAFGQDVAGMEPRPHRGADFGLLGRDYLAHVRFVYDGPRGAFTLIAADPPPG